MNFGLRFLITYSACSLCVLLLTYERHDVIFTLQSKTQVNMSANFSDFNSRLNRYDLTQDDQREMFVNATQTYFKSDLHKYATCVPLGSIEIYRNRSVLNLGNVSEELFEYFNTSIYNHLRVVARAQSDGYYYLTLESLHNSSAQLLKLSETVFLGAIKAKQFLIFNNQFCIVLDYRFQLSLSRIVLENTRHFAFAEGFYNFVELEKENEDVNMVFVLNHKNPNVDCAKNESIFTCLNDCFRAHQNLSRYFYRADEDVLIQLNDENNSTAEHEASCFEMCKEKECKLSHHTKVYSSSVFSTAVIEAERVVNEIDFLFQLVALILSFIGICCYKLSFKLIALFLRVKNYSDKTVTRFRTMFTSLCSTFLLFFSLLVMYQYQDRMKNPPSTETTTSLLEPQPLSLAVCVHLDRLLNGSDDQLHRMSFSELQNRTESAFDETLHDLYLEFQEKKFNVTWEPVSSKVVFFSPRPGLLARCFLVKVRPEEPKYQSILSSSKLTLDFKHDEYSLYLLPEENEHFHSRSYKYAGRGFEKMFKGSSKAEKCMNYGETYERCKTRWSCIDECVHNKSATLLRTEQRTKYELRVVDKDRFADESEWKSSYPKNSFNEEIYRIFETECKKMLPDPDCLEVKFQHRTQLEEQPEMDKRRVQIEMYYNEIRIQKEEPSFYRLILDLVSVQTVVFNLNFLEIATLAYCYVRFKLNFMDSNLYMYIIYLLIAIGMFAHILTVFYQISGDQLVHSQYFEETSLLEAPELLFCFDYNHSSPMDGEMTGEHLEKITSDLTAERVFEEVAYLNEMTDEWVSLKSNFSIMRGAFGVSTFYYLQKKCFKIVHPNINYSRQRLFFRNNTDVLKVNFNRSFIEDQRVIFLTKRPNKMQLSKLMHLDFKKANYSVSQEKLIYQHNDKFIVIKDPLYLVANFSENYLNNVDRFLVDLMTGFRERYNSSTLNLPLEQHHFHLQIRDRQFDDYCKEQDAKHQNATLDPNYSREFDINHLEEFDDGSERPDFAFRLLFLRKKIHVSAPSNWGKLLLNVMNVLSLWFNLNLFDSFFCKVIFIYLSNTVNEKKKGEYEESITESSPGSPERTQARHKQDTPRPEKRHDHVDHDQIPSVSGTVTHLGRVLAGDHEEKAFDFDAPADHTEYSTFAADHTEYSHFSDNESIFSKDFSVHYQSVDEEANTTENEQPDSSTQRRLERAKSISLEAIMEEGEQGEREKDQHAARRQKRELRKHATSHH